MNLIYVALPLFVFLTFFFPAAGMKRWMALLAAFFNLAALYFFAIPFIEIGAPPFVAVFFIQIIAAAFAVRAVLGWGKKYFAALFGALITIAFAGVSAGEVANIMKLPSVFFPALEEPLGLFAHVLTSKSFSTGQLLAAAAMIASAGAVIYVAVCVSSRCWEKMLKSKKVAFPDIWKSGLDAGKEIIPGMINSVILIFTAIVLPFLTASYMESMPLIVILNSEIFVLAVTCGLISIVSFMLAAPVTTYFCCLFYRKR